MRSNKQMNEIEKTIQDMKEEINKDMETLKNNQSKINNSISQINITIKSLVNRVEQVKSRVSGMENKVEELDQTVKDHERMLRIYEWNVQDIWDTMKRPNLQTMGVEAKQEIQTKGTDNLFNRIIAENFPELKKESPRYRKLTEHQTDRFKKRNTARHIIIKTLSTQNKERILKATNEKRQVTYKGNHIRIRADFSTQTLNARWSWKDITQVLKESNHQPRLVYPAKLSFLIEGQIKTFCNKEKLKEFVTTKPIYM
jgi:prophage DNA circulation protein